MEVRVSFQSLEAWQDWRDAHPFATDGDYIDGLVRSARRLGIVSPWLGPVAPSSIEVRGRNYREAFVACGLSARARAVLDTFAQLPEAGGIYTTRMYAPESLTPFALALRGRYPLFTSSEYLADKADRERLFPIPHEDLGALGFPDARFDVAFCNDVFEHVADLPRALGELARVLRPGGRLLSTFPFAYNQRDTIVKAKAGERGPVFLAEPEYHPNPVDPEGGSLVYQIPGWDVLELARARGFATAEMLFVSSWRQGLCAAELAGVFLLQAVR